MVHDVNVQRLNEAPLLAAFLALAFAVLAAKDKWYGDNAELGPAVLLPAARRAALGAAPEVIALAQQLLARFQQKICLFADLVRDGTLRLDLLR